jgi:hypothetical protein
MWLTREDEELQKNLEKLVDWELSKQLAWVAVFVATTLGVITLIVAIPKAFLGEGSIVVASFPLITVNLSKIGFALILVILLFAVDFSFYRIACTHVNIKGWIERLPNDFKKRELLNKGAPKIFYDIFTVKTGDKSFPLNRWVVFLLVMFGDLLLILPTGYLLA